PPAASLLPYTTLFRSGSDEVRIVHDLATERHGVARVVRRCADLAETLAVTAGGIGDVVFIDMTVRGLGRDVLSVMLRDAAVVGMRSADAADTMALGLRQMVLADAPVEQILAAIEPAVAGQQEDSEAWVQKATTADPPGTGGRGVVVWGPLGAPGRSTVAVKLAAEAAAPSRETTLFDADTYGPSLYQLLGVLDEAPG